MNKITKLLSVFVIAGTVSAGVAAFAGCHTHTYDEKWSTSETQHWHAATCEHEDEKKDLGNHVDANDDGKCDTCGYQMEVVEEHQHTYSDEWSTSETQHWHAATCEHTDQKKDLANHVDANDDGKCDTCGYQMKTGGETEGIPAPVGTNGLVIEKTTTAYELSASAPAIDIAVDDIKVYFAKGTEKLEEVNLSDCLIMYSKGSQQLENLNGINAAGKYTIMVKIDNVLVSGETQTRTLVNTVVVEVTDPVVANSLAINDDAVKTQTQSTTDNMTSTWKFTVTLASGTKVDVTEEVTISGVETTSVGEREATITITYDSTNLTLTVPYSITADQNSHSVSYAVNFGGFEIGTISEGTELKQGDVVVAKSLTTEGAKISSSKKEMDGKIFTQRFQFAGGSFTSSGSYQKNRAIEINTLGAAKITVYWAASGAGRGVAISDEETYASLTLSSNFLMKDIDDVGDGSLNKSEVNVNEAGKYYLTTATSSDIYIFYIQVDNIVSGAGEDIGLPTETETQGIELDTSKAIKTYTVGDEFSSENIVVKKAVVNPVTCDATYETVTDTENVTYTGYDMSKLGEQTVTVTYNGFTDTYTITVESAIAGITGVSASLADGFNNQLGEGETTLTVKKSDIVVSLVGENAEANVTSYTVKLNGEEIDETGKALSEGEYTLNIEAVVSDGTNNVTFTCTFTFSIVGQGIQDVKYTITAEDVAAIGGTNTTNEYELVPGIIVVGTNCKAAEKEVTVDGITCEGRVQVTGQFKPSNVGDKSIKLTVSSAATIKVICAGSSEGKGPLNLYNSNGELIASGTNTSATAALETYSVSAGGTFYLGSSSGGVNIWYIEIDYSGN